MKFLRRTNKPAQAVEEPNSDDMRALVEHLFHNPHLALYPQGPSLALTQARDTTTNPWFVEPALRDTYTQLTTEPPAPADEHTARLIAWAHASASSDEWPDYVFPEARILNTTAYQQHAALLLAAYPGTPLDFIHHRQQPCRPGWTPTTDPLYRDSGTTNTTMEGTSND